jgi:cytochrome P450
MGMSFLHLNPELFEDPHAFRPERWLEERGDKENLETWLIPFSKGSRSCVGLKCVMVITGRIIAIALLTASFWKYSLAWAELYLILGNMIRKLDMQVYNTA